MRVADLIPTVTGSYPKNFQQLVQLVDDQQKKNCGLPMSTARITTKGS